MSDDGKLTQRQRKFCTEYVRTSVGSKAAVSAGYSPKGAGRAANRLLLDPRIKAEVDRMNGNAAKEAEVSATWVLHQAVELHRRCMQEIRPIVDKKGNQILDEEGNLMFEFDAANAARSLDMVGRHVGVGAWKDSVEHTGAGGAPLPAPVLNFIVNCIKKEETTTKAIEI